jgi:hypothetical protein
LSEPISAKENLVEFLFPIWELLMSISLAPVIAALGILIAFNQWRLAKLSLKEKLFDRRYKIIDASKEFAIASRFGPEEDAKRAHQNLIRIMGEAKYLFSIEVHDSILALLENAGKKRLYENISAQRGHQMSESDWNDVNSKLDLADETMRETIAKIDILTAPYMKLGKV